MVWLSLNLDSKSLESNRIPISVTQLKDWLCLTLFVKCLFKRTVSFSLSINQSPRTLALMISICLLLQLS